MARTAQMWHQRPSTMLGIPNPLIAYLVDDALALRIIAKGRPMTDPARRHEHGAIPDGLVYEDLSALADAVRERERNIIH